LFDFVISVVRLVNSYIAILLCECVTDEASSGWKLLYELELTDVREAALPLCEYSSKSFCVSYRSLNCEFLLRTMSGYYPRM